MTENKKVKKSVVSKEKNNKKVNGKELKEKKEKEIVTTETKQDTSFVEENKAMWKDIVRKIWDIFFWTAFAILLCIWIIDYIRVGSEKDPKFCLKKETLEYEDGTVSKCTGLGYKVYNYNRESLDKGIEFGPFFIKMKEPENK